MKTVKVGHVSTKVGEILVRLEPNVAVKGLNINPFTAIIDSNRNKLEPIHVDLNQSLTHIGRYLTDFYSFHLDISNCDATRARIELESYHSY